MVGEKARLRATFDEATLLYDEVRATRQYLWDETYDAAGYLRVLYTYSGHRSLSDDARGRLFRGIASLIDGQFGGSIVKGYLTTLYVVHRR